MFDNFSGAMNNIDINTTTPFIFIGLAFIFLAIVYLLFVAVIYVFTSICLYKIAKKISVEPYWMAWVPIANFFLIIKMAGKSYWWFVLLLIPGVNIATWVIIWINIVKKFGLEEWYAILMIVPLVNFVVLGYLAFSNKVKLTSVGAPVIS